MAKTSTLLGMDFHLIKSNMTKPYVVGTHNLGYNKFTKNLDTIHPFSLKPISIVYSLWTLLCVCRLHTFCYILLIKYPRLVGPMAIDISPLVGEPWPRPEGRSPWEEAAAPPPEAQSPRKEGTDTHPWEVQRARWRGVMTPTALQEMIPPPPPRPSKCGGGGESVRRIFG